MTTHETAEALVERWLAGVSVPEAVRLVAAAFDAHAADAARVLAEACVTLDRAPLGGPASRAARRAYYDALEAYRAARLAGTR